MRSPLLSLSLIALASACTGGGDARPAQKLVAYDATDDCAAFDEADCAAHDECQWIALGLPCKEGEPCVSGVCQAVDPCRAHGDEGACSADTDNRCAWAAIGLLCPAGSDCPEGFCYQVTDDDNCTCLCPLACPEGADCPPCQCDCDGGGSTGGGSTCTCTAPDCAPGETCPPATCDCTDDGGGGDACGDCTCVCPPCAEGEACEPCSCSCDDGSGSGTVEPGGTTTCVCPTCPDGESCPACDCGTDSGSGSGASDQPEPIDPCTEHADEASCTADTEQGCAWLPNPCPLSEGDLPGGDCPDYACHHVSEPEPCTCVCPTCVDGETCPPCDCQCGVGSGCAEPATVGPGTTGP